MFSPNSHIYYQLQSSVHLMGFISTMAITLGVMAKSPSFSWSRILTTGMTGSQFVCVKHVP